MPLSNTYPAVSFPGTAMNTREKARTGSLDCPSTGKKKGRGDDQLTISNHYCSDLYIDILLSM